LQDHDVAPSGSKSQQLHRVLKKLNEKKIARFEGAFGEIRDNIVENYICLHKARCLLGNDARFLTRNSSDKKWTASVPTEMHSGNDDVYMTKVFDSLDEAASWAKPGLEYLS